MKHHEYKDGETINMQLDEKTAISIKLHAIGVTPSKVSATWTKTGGKTGIAYGGFQSSKDFDFQVASRAALENAVAQAKV